MILKDDFGASIGGGALFGAGESGVDQLVGDLTETGGVWRGVVTGTAKRSIQTIVLGVECKDELSGTQQIKVVGTPGTYADGANLRLAFSPVGPPKYTRYPKCSAPPIRPKAKNGIEWLDFYFDAYQDQGLEVHLPDRPGGTWEKEGCSVSGAEITNCGDKRRLTVTYK